MRALTYCGERQENIYIYIYSVYILQHKKPQREYLKFDGSRRAEGGGCPNTRYKSRRHEPESKHYRACDHKLLCNNTRYFEITKRDTRTKRLLIGPRTSLNLRPTREKGGRTTMPGGQCPLSSYPYLVAADAIVLTEGSVALHHHPAPFWRDCRVQPPREADVALHLHRREGGVQRLRRCCCACGMGGRGQRRRGGGGRVEVKGVRIHVLMGQRKTSAAVRGS